MPAPGERATATGFGQSWHFVQLGIEHILIGVGLAGCWWLLERLLA